MEEGITLRCKRCDTLIPVENIDQERQLAKCSECNALFGLATEWDVQPLLRWPDILLPKGLKVESLENELKIVYRWFGTKYIFLTPFCLLWNGAFLASFFSTWNFWLLLFPHFWFGLGMAYYILTGMINKTTLSVTPDLLKIEHGPLPYFGNKRLDPINLKQLYVKEKIHRKGSARYSYEIYMITWQEHDKKLLGGLANPDQAFFLEQEIERFLGLKDKPVSGEYSQTATYYYRGIKWSSWEKLAKANKLTFTQGKLLGDYRIFGNYEGYHLNLMAFQKRERGQDIPSIRLVLTATQPGETGSKGGKKPKRGMSSQKVAELLNSMVHYLAKGHFRAEPGGREIIYEQPGLETNTNYLERLFDALRQMLDAYPQAIALGAEVVPAIQDIAADKDHPSYAVALQLLQDIAPTTHHLRPRVSSLLCKRCLVRCDVHEVKLPGLETMILCGCQLCWQSRDFFEVGQVIVVLDRRMSTKVAQHDQIVRVNWLSRRDLFDFDQIEIINAADEEVERFAIQVGNDTHPLRQPRYKEMDCLVAKDCRLSQNSLRVLQRTFGQVTVLHK